MQGCRPRRPGRCPGLARAWGRVRPHARRYRGSLAYPWPCVVGAVLVGPTLAAGAARGMSPVPAWSVMPYPHPPRQRSCHGGCYPGPAPLHAVRVQQGDAPSLRSVTLPAWPLPAFRSAAWSVVPPLRAGDGPPLPLSRVQASSPVATGLSCRVLVLEDSDGHAARQALRSQTPRPAGRRAWQCAALGRAACARHAGRVPVLPPSAGGRSAGVRAGRPDARRRSCAGRPLPLL